MNDKRKSERGIAAPLVILLGLNALLIGAPYLYPGTPPSDWYKGPLIDPVSPYSAAGGVRMLGVALAAMMDLGLVFAFIGFRFVRRREKGRGAAMMVVLAISGVLSFAVVEGGLRAYLSANVKTMFMPDAHLNWRLVPHLKGFFNVVGEEYVTTNSLGWRAPEPPKTPDPQALRGMLLGDSSAYGLGVEEPRTMARELGRDLQAALPDRDVTIYNAACPGHTTHQGLKLIQRNDKRLDPDLVIVAYNNDPALEYFTDREREAEAGRLKGLQEVLYHSRLFIILRQVLLGAMRGYALDWEDPSEVHREAVDGKEMKNRVPVNEYEDNLRQMAEYAKKADFTLVFVRMPVNFDVERFVPRFYDERYPAALHKVADETGTLIVDVHERWMTQGIHDFLPGHIFHPNAEGHERIGRQIYRALKERGFVPKNAPDAPDDDADGEREEAAPSVEGATPLRFGASSITPLHTAIGEVLARTDIAAKHGFAVEVEFFERGDEQARAAGRLDATFTTEVPAIAFLEAHPDWRVVGSTGKLGRIALLTKDPAVNAVADLRSKRIGVPYDSTPHAHVTRWLEAARLAPGADVALDDIGMRDLAAAVDDGRVAAIGTWDPWVTDLTGQGYRTLESMPFYSLMILRDGYLQEHPGAAATYRALLADAVRYARENAEEVMPWVHERSQIDAATLAAVLRSSGQWGDGPVDFTVPPEALTSLRQAYAFLHRVRLEDVDDDEGWKALVAKFETPPGSAAAP
ncbi:MAG: hypothetical protein H6683_04445 [Deltaproteobacteria bacterium]|nr:hypothetical protein [Deltaproteobacteria bacterium]